MVFLEGEEGKYTNNMSGVVWRQVFGFCRRHTVVEKVKVSGK